MNDIKVSTIIPTYKGWDVIDRAVRSVISQELDASFEVIVVDDNDPQSADRQKTEQVMEQFSNDERVIYIKHERNRNGAAARNTGFSHSKGRYICFLDDDDIFLPNKLQHQVDYMDVHPEFGASYTWRLMSNDEIIKCNKTGDLSEDILTLSFTPTTITIMMRRECYEALHGHDESFRRHQDFEFQLRFFQKFQMGVVEEPLSKIIGGANSNQLHGEELEAMKRHFFEQLSPMIEQVELKHPGAKKRVYASHYAAVFRDHLKYGHKNMVWPIVRKATTSCGGAFWKLVVRDMCAALFRRIKH